MIEQARQMAAERYPEALVDTLGRIHRCIPREAILRGDFDDGSLVRDFLAKLDQKEGAR